jgi:hypothetical protein
MTEKNPEALTSAASPSSAVLKPGHRMVLEHRGRDSLRETVTIRGSDAGLEEGRLALHKGALVTELHLVATIGDHQWQWSLKGESFDVIGLKVPSSAPVQHADEVEGAVIERLHHVNTLFNLIDTLFGFFVRVRLSSEWSATTVPAMRRWIADT